MGLGDLLALRRARARGVVLGLAALLSAGCAIQFQDAQGTTHVLGLVHVQLRETPAARSRVVAQQVSVLGGALLMRPDSTAASFGFTRTFNVSVFAADDGGVLQVPLDNPTASTFTDLETVAEELR